ncbi:hypothetical protein C7I85_29515 [Mesorhizobium soli]|uniref:Uncharacterized protein n=1 Tax=Pseudaminobacter soli (ex Li et al. 2025) TaxID=1295366 RepID=A0A2P7RMC9_9HYPH|nr:hypothetical protein C7I85_29515 [Mesorhizobium soli]
MLDALVQRAVDILGIADQGDRNEAAARILSLYTPRRSKVRGNRGNSGPPTKAAQEQRRKLARER